MSAALHSRVLAFLQRHGMMPPGCRVAAGVSGGADSVALLRILTELRDALGIRLVVAHYNHQLRGADSDADEKFVERLAAEFNTEFVAGRGDVRGRARAQRRNLEDAARRMRYAFLEKLVADGCADRVAVAHTADDQAETVIGRLLRGTGPAGLGGIYPVRGPVIRPLLEIRRQELRDYLNARHQAWREDATNRDALRLRARIRQRLLPLLEQEFQPAITGHLGELARLAREDEAFWSALVDSALKCMVEQTEHGITVAVEDLLRPFRKIVVSPVPDDVLTAFSARLIRRLAARQKTIPGELGAVHVAQVLDLARRGASGRRIPLPGGVVVERSFDRLLFISAPQRESNAKTSGGETAYEYCVSIPAGGCVSVTIPALRKRLELKLFDWPAAPSDTRAEEEALDFDRLRPPLVLRNWRPGDAYRPAGRKQPRKLKELFIRRRIPAGQRPAWPVLTSAGQVVWSLGMPVAHEFAARRYTRAGLKIVEETAGQLDQETL